ncbi:MAG: magnesium-translocating P-type ATPase [bacterium]
MKNQVFEVLSNTFKNYKKTKKEADRTLYINEVLQLSAKSNTEFVLRFFDTTLNGLSELEVNDRVKEYGLNVISHEKPKNAVTELLKTFINPLNILLLTLSLVSCSIGDIKAATVIFLMVLVSVFLTFSQEYRSNQAAEKLREMVNTTATTIRQRKILEEEIVNDEFEELVSENFEIPLQDLVPGDIIRLSAGDIIPADVRILSAKDLFIAQAALTGEAMPVEKIAVKEKDQSQGALEFQNICYMGSTVISGTAFAVVILTGNNTYFGKIALELSKKREQTSFEKGINGFAWLMIRFMLVMAPMVFFINGFSKGNWFESLLFAIAVVVGLTPEMLPMIVTVNLAKGALEMSKSKVIVKKLNSIQNFGAMDVLCSDKTGTLTQDKIILERHVDFYGFHNDNVLTMGYINSYYQTGLKNLLDIAVLEHAELNKDRYIDNNFKIIDELPFDFVRKRMSVIVNEQNNKHLLICKGAVEELFEISRKVEINGETLSLEETDVEKAKNVVKSLNEDGFRVIAVAYKEMPTDRNVYTLKDEHDLTIAGFLAFLDPPKESAAQAIKLLNNHGVSVKILTGDNDAVTRKVCKEVGLPYDKVVLGHDIDSMTDDELAEVAETTTIFAKLSPSHKEQIVKALHRKNHVVGFLGDGINDAPALKAADVGISVDTAVDIAKESADIILLEKNLLVLEKGVVQGRKVFGNIIKYVRMGASSNFGNMFSVIGASFFLPFLPMLPIQILTNNLLYDMSQTVIPTDDVDKEFLRNPRQWNIDNIKKFMMFIGPISSIFDYATFFMMLYVFHSWKNPALFHTGWFVESLLSQSIIIHVIRTTKIPFIQSRASLPMMLTTIIVVSIALWLPFSPLASALGFVALPKLYFVLLTLMMITYAILTQFVKMWFFKRFGVS